MDVVVVAMVEVEVDDVSTPRFTFRCVTEVNVTVVVDDSVVDAFDVLDVVDTPVVVVGADD